MTAKQISVFIENRQGRLADVLSALKEKDVNILSLSLADTAEYGLLRLIVNAPEEGRKILSEKGFSTMLTKVLVVKIDHKSGSLNQLVKELSLSEINVEYMYGLSTQTDAAYVVIKVSDVEKTEEIFKKIGVIALSAEEIAKL